MLVVVAVCGAVAVAAPAVGAADPGDIGTKGPSFAGASATVPPSGSKPESKLWFADGLWWAAMFDTASGDFRIFRLDAGTQTWADTGVAIDDRNNSIPDALWDGSKLYVASHVYSESPRSGYPSRLYRYSYDPGTDAYTLDAGFPVQINNYRTETLVIAKDSTGQLWATWTQGNQVWVNRTVCSPVCSDSSWGAPFSLAVAALASDDISSVVAFETSVGVMWSNQANNTMDFALHADADPTDTAWTTEVALSGTGMADDHINLKADTSGRVFAATKTSKSTSSSPLNLLLVRTAGGTWVSHVFGLKSDAHTRPIVLLDTVNSLVRMFATSGESGGTIYEKDLPLADAENGAVDFPSGKGDARVRDADALKMNNATSTKQNLDSSMGILVLATNKKTNVTPQIEDYWHHFENLGSPPPDTTPPALGSQVVVSGTLTLTYDEALNESSVPAYGDYTIGLNGGAGPLVTGVAVAGSAVTLTLAAPVAFGDTVTLDYTAGASPVEDVALNDALGLTGQAVTNSTPPPGSALTLLPNGDGAIDPVIKDQSGGTTNLYAAIDETIAAADDGTTYVRNNNKASGNYLCLLTDTPAAFASMLTLTIDVRARTTGAVDDQTTLYAQIFAADGTTPLTGEVAVAVNPGPSGWTTISGITFTGIVAGDKATWDGARLRLRWAYGQVGTADSTQIRVTAVEVDGTFG